jgi:cobalt-zinc-cadmium efflux system protein
MSKPHGLAITKKRPTKRMIIVLCLTAFYMFAEAVGGIVSNSLSLLADAGHMLADVVALSISLVAFALASRPASNRASFGYYRAEVIAALFNGVVLLIVSFFIIKEAVLRFLQPAAVESNMMIAIAVGGLLINVVGLVLLQQDKSENLNVKGAWLHVLSDALSSVGVIISGLLIYFFNWYLADPITSIAIACLVSYTALRLILETINVLMEHVPGHIDPLDVEKAILSVSNATKVHDLHIWSITSGHEALSVHIVLKPGGDFGKLLHDVEQILEKKFGITHTTIQIETISEIQDSTC